MGAWMCPLCGHGKFTRPYRGKLARMCDRQGCGYIERAQDYAGLDERKKHRKEKS